jgi:hypothetical protein
MEQMSRHASSLMMHHQSFHQSSSTIQKRFKNRREEALHWGFPGMNGSGINDFRDQTGIFLPGNPGIPILILCVLGPVIATETFLFYFRSLKVQVARFCLHPTVFPPQGTPVQAESNDANAVSFPALPMHNLSILLTNIISEPNLSLSLAR